MRVQTSVGRLLICIALALLAVSLAAVPASAQAVGALSGRVVGSETGRPASDATVVAVADGDGREHRTRAGGDGAFRFARLPAGAYTVRASRIGFMLGNTVSVIVPAGGEARAEIRLGEETFYIDTIRATNRRDTQRERVRFETEAGVTTRVIQGDELKILPGLAEADVMRAVEVLPGVVSTSDFSSAFHVRGGSADQNLILLDGFPIFNPFHLGGLFSVFNADVVARAELLAGGFGAEYGGRVSSVLNVETEPGGGEEGFAVETGVSLLASRVALHGNLPGALPRALGGDQASWMVSARRSYFDVVLKPVVDFPYHLTDLQGTATIGVAGGGRLRFVGYTGEDVLDFSDFDPPGLDEDEGDILRIRWNWGNDVAGVRWEQPWGPWVTTASLGYSRYAESLGFVEFADTRFASRVDLLSLRADAARSLGDAVTVRFGAEAARMSYHNIGESGGTIFFEGRNDGRLGAGYAQLRWQRGGWIVEPGLRADSWMAGTTRTHLSPRLAVKRFFGAERDGAVKLAAGRYVQFLHSLRDESLPVSNDNWVTSDEYVPAVVSDQVQLGVEKYWGEEWYGSVEGYYRGYEGVTDFNVGDDPNDPSDDLLEGDGWSYGVDMMVRRNTGRVTGWATLSLLRAERTFPDPLAQGIDGVPQEVTFSPVFDRRVDLDVVMQYRLPGRIDAGLRLNYGSGVPYTRPIAQFVGFETDVAGSGYRVPRPVGDDPEIPLYIVPGERNRERYPSYQRLDLTLRRTYRPRWGTFTPYLQVLNATNRKNVLFYFYDYDRTPPTRSGISMFPTLPAFGFEATF